MRVRKKIPIQIYILKYSLSLFQLHILRISLIIIFMQAKQSNNKGRANGLLKFLNKASNNCPYSIALNVTTTKDFFCFRC